MYDTVKGGDYITDQDAAEYMCSEGPKAVFELEHMGLPFSRFDNGRIYAHSGGGFFVALDAATGEEVWRAHSLTPPSLHARPFACGYRNVQRTVADKRYDPEDKEKEAVRAWPLTNWKGKSRWAHAFFVETSCRESLPITVTRIKIAKCATMQMVGAYE